YNIYEEKIMINKQKITIKDIAKEVGCSIATVSRVLSNKPSSMISEKTKETIIKKAHEMNYRPNRLAQALVTGTSKTIALFAYSITTDYYSFVISRLNSIIKKDNYDLKIIESDNQLINTNLNELFVDGIILFDTVDYISEDIQKFALNNKPTVCIGSRYNKKYNYVISNLEEGYSNALNHLYNIGKRKILLGENNPTELDYRIYQKFIKEKNLKPYIIENANFSSFNRHFEVNYNILAKYIKENGVDFDAICCKSDSQAIAFIRCLTDNNIKIPEDVAITGTDGTAVSNFYNPRLTTILQPLDKMCEKSWEILKKHIENPDLPPESYTYDTELIIRESTVK
ncbi:MAG: LacI family DNA-binding transcriptional regulator, partial [Armatimonadetes bacterium]|nr:LacI family DNA-binding transcriptional regulator [Candidatus Hippobium faecium]